MTRQVNFNGYIQKMAPMLLIWGTMVHEYGHLIALRFMGLSGEIRSTGLNLTWLLNGATSEQLLIWRFAGGFTQALYGLYNMLYESDNETWLSGLTVACVGLIYAVFETQREIMLGSIISITITTLLILLLHIRETIKFD